MKLTLGPVVACMTLLWSFAHAGESEQDSLDARIRAIIESPDVEYVKPVNCLSTLTYDTVEILDDRHLLFRGRSKDKLWVNQLRGRCVGLRPGMTLQFDLHGDRACNLDTVRGVESFFYFWEQTTGACALGQFQPVTEAQAQMIGQAIRGE